MSTSHRPIRRPPTTPHQLQQNERLMRRIMGAATASKCWCKVPPLAFLNTNISCKLQNSAEQEYRRTPKDQCGGRCTVGITVARRCRHRQYRRSARVFYRFSKHTVDTVRKSSSGQMVMEWKPAAARRRCCTRHFRAFCVQMRHRNNGSG